MVRECPMHRLSLRFSGEAGVSPALSRSREPTGEPECLGPWYQPTVEDCGHRFVAHPGVACPSPERARK